MHLLLQNLSLQCERFIFHISFVPWKIRGKCPNNVITLVDVDATLLVDVDVALLVMLMLPS